jgi:hypothetical protein
LFVGTKNYLTPRIPSDSRFLSFLAPFDEPESSYLDFRSSVVPSLSAILQGSKVWGSIFFAFILDRRSLQERASPVNPKDGPFPSLQIFFSELGTFTRRSLRVWPGPSP